MRMPESIALAFAKFMQAANYDTRMWERGYTQDAANGVCAALSKWGHEKLGLEGDFLMVWSVRNGTRFSGDSELTYITAEAGYLLPNPFIEGVAEEFLAALGYVTRGEFGHLYKTSVSGRVLFNATT